MCKYIDICICSSPQRIAHHIQYVHKKTTSTPQQSSPAPAGASPGFDQEQEKQEEEKEQEQDLKRTICKAKLGGLHKMCGKCGAIYVKLRKHKLYCKDIVKQTQPNKESSIVYTGDHFFTHNPPARNNLAKPQQYAKWYLNYTILFYILVL